MATIIIKDSISRDLALRDYAKIFFNFLESSPDQLITIDFADVLSISRSFAHEYIKNKEKSTKTIQEINIPNNIQRMFDIVTDHTEKAPLIDTDNTKVLTI